MALQTKKSLLLGTAQWGWTVSSEAAFGILDAWLGAGHHFVDAATNYPINKNPADFRASERILQEYIQAHGLRNLGITMKIGSQDNLRSPDINLSLSFIRMMAEEYLRLFGENLKVVMVHWDNRSDEASIRATLEGLAGLQQEFGLRAGLSGIRFPEVYHRANLDLNLLFDIQVKHNILHTDLPRYAPFLSGAGHRFFGYGINAGGLKLEGPYPAQSTYLSRGGDPEKTAGMLEQIRKLIPKWSLAAVRPPVCSLNHIGLIYGGLNPQLDGLVLGFSSMPQLLETLDFWRNLESFDYSDVFSDLGKHTN